jgi:ribonuclease VapC
VNAENKIPRFVFDSYALIAFLQDEPGAARVTEIFEQAGKEQAEVYLAIVNFGEVIYITQREQGLTAAQQVIASIDQLPIQVADADRKLTFAAAHIKGQHALSYADAFAVALAQSKDATICTGDMEFAGVENEVRIDWLPAK